MSAERSGSLNSGEPTPTGREFLRLIGKYKGDYVPPDTRDAFWRRAANITGNKELLEIMDRADEKKIKQQEALRRAIHTLTGF